ncbi:MAG: RDD family protein [Lentisphaeraceae bacterium]|nr:RDD family protein [Lentisphaeraceae bacterium]
MEANPYASPDSEEIVNTNEVKSEIAERGTRLVAVILDSLIGILFFLPAILILVLSGALGEGGDKAGPMMIVFAVVMLVSFLALLIINLRLIIKHGQTIGKKIMKIKIVDFNTHEHPGGGKIIGLRMIVTGLLGVIPIVGSIISIVDPLLIFRESNQCLHDQIANTIVVKA